MTLLQMKTKVLQLIEEISQTENKLTDDPDIEAKLHAVIDQVMHELARIKKIAAVTVKTVESNTPFDLKTVERFYQLDRLRIKDEEGDHIGYELFGNFVTAQEDGEAVIMYYKYPEPITDETADTYEFELTEDVLELMPYGVAADLLKSDVSANYGQVYAKRYEDMLARLDPRHSKVMAYVEGGVDI